MFVVSEIRSPLETNFGDPLVLSCQTIWLSTIYALQVHIQWLGPNGTTFDGRNGIALGSQQSRGGLLHRNLAFDFLRSTMDGEYTCQVTIGELYTDINHFHLRVAGKR